MRRRLSITAKIRIFDAASGYCHLCGLPIIIQAGEKWDIDHVKPLWLGGRDDETNMRPAHIRCHRSKTSKEAGTRSKGTRIRARHIGVKRHLKSRPLLGTFASGWKNLMNGEWERR